MSISILQHFGSWWLYYMHQKWYEKFYLLGFLARVIKLFKLSTVFLLIWNFIRVLMTYAFGFLHICEWHIEGGNRRGPYDPHSLLSSYTLIPACSNPFVTSVFTQALHTCSCFCPSHLSNTHIEPSVQTCACFWQVLPLSGFITILFSFY